LEGLERGPAGNTSLTAAFALAQTMPQDAIIVVQETEYTGAGKHPLPQLSFAKQNGISLITGDPELEQPGTDIILPDHPNRIRIRHYDLQKAKVSYIRNCVANAGAAPLTADDIAFIAADIKADTAFVNKVLNELNNNKA